MNGGTEPKGTLSFYYTNQQSARLMFYHDHALEQPALMSWWEKLQGIS